MDFKFHQGSVPLLISMPHVGTDIPDDIAARLSPAALRLADTDWHLERLYDFTRDLGASTLAARWSRYVIDLNRPPENTNLYPGLDTTSLCPIDTFHREPLYRDGAHPDTVEIRRRIHAYWQPYHDRLTAEVARLVRVHGIAVVWDAHSIASMVPRFFDGKLPDLNFGTADGDACRPELMDAVMARGQHTVYSQVRNGRFKGGYITRNYGRPSSGVHAIQLEMAQCVYMDEVAPFAYRHDLALQVKLVLRDMLETAIAWVRGQVR